MVGKNEIKWQPVTQSDKWAINIAEMSYGNKVMKLAKPSAEVITSEAHIRMTRGTTNSLILFSLDDFETIESDLRNKFTCTFNSGYLFYCYAGPESASKFPPIKIVLNDLEIVLTSKDYVIFVNIYI